MVDLGDNTTKRINYLQLVIMSFVYDCDVNSEEVVVKDSCLSLIREIINYLEVFIDQSGATLAMGDKKRILRIVRKLRTIVSEWGVCLNNGIAWVVIRYSVCIMHLPNVLAIYMHFFYYGAKWILTPLFLQVNRHHYNSTSTHE